jgi:hypothetical protein
VQYFYPLRNAVTVSSKTFLPGKDNQLQINGTAIAASAAALAKVQPISITALQAADIPSLTMGMVNITKENSGYRYLPHGNLFKEPAVMKLHYDPEKLPVGYTEKDIAVYYFAETQKEWLA